MSASQPARMGSCGDKSNEVSHCRVESGAVSSIFGRDLLAMNRRLRFEWTDCAFGYWRDRGFPFPTLSASEIQSEYWRLARVEPRSLIRGKMIGFSAVGLRLANSYHPQMWSARLHDHARSPLDQFNDDLVLRKLLERTMRFWPDRRCWNDQCLRSAFRIYAGGRVSNFRPSAARALIARYSSDGATVLDFCAGYGGRLLGAITLARRYIGIDPDPKQHAGLQAMLRALKYSAAGTATIYRDCAERCIERLPSAFADLVISSPPYFLQERYSSHPLQSSVRYPNYAVWKSKFLFRVLAECERVLKPGGHLIINVKDTRDHEVASDTRQFLNGILVPVTTMRLTMTSRPQQDGSGQAALGYEPVFVYQKLLKHRARRRNESLAI